MTSVLRIAHLRIAHQGAILRWAILRVILITLDSTTTLIFDPTMGKLIFYKRKPRGLKTLFEVWKQFLWQKYAQTQ